MENAVRASENGHRVYPRVMLFEERDRQWQRLTTELRELDQKIQAGEGYRVSTTITFLEESYFVFDGNYLNLRHVLDEFEQPTLFLKLFDERDRGRLNLFIRDTIRLFHNYLAAAATLLDHTRILTDDLYQETSFADEYRQRVDQQFANSSLPHFVEDLRNYMLHKGLPFALAELNFDRVGSGVEVGSDIKLDVVKLRGWERWSEKGREYLDALDDKVKLGDVIDEYAFLVVDFYKWFRGRQSELHHETLKELEELEGKREHLRNELRRLEDPLELTEKAVSAMREERRRLVDDLESERRRSEQLEQERLQLQEDQRQLEAERSKGLWGRIFRG